MEIVELYANSIWSVKYEGDPKDIFYIKINQWRDIEYLDEFFNANKNRIENLEFWRDVPIQDMILAVRQESINILKEFKKLYWNGVSGLKPDFDDRFVILERNAITDDAINRRKMYGDSKGLLDTSLLRLYAIKIPPDNEDESAAYIITGGGIKLTSNMEQMRELAQEYRKMLGVQEWLKQNGIKVKTDLYTYKNDR